MRLAPAMILAAALCLTAAAEDSQRILRIQAFDGDGLGSGEATALQNLVTSYVVELKMFRVIDAEGQELALKEAETAVQLGVPKDIAPLAADFILSANASAAGGLIVFTMDVTRVSSGEKRSVSETASSVNELILASRRMTRSLLEQPQAETATPAGPELPVGAAGTAAGTGTAPISPAEQGRAAQIFLPAPTLAKAAGTWKGDKGLERVSLFADGRGIAILASGASMKVKTSVDGASIVVAQDQPSIPEFYRSSGMDFKTARSVAAQARPWKWIFSLSEDGNTLVGVKQSVFVRVDTAGTVSVDNNYVRDAEWTRLFR